MTSNTFIKIKRLVKPTLQPQDVSQVDEQLEAEPTQPLEIEQPEQPAPTVHLESLAEVTPDESLFGSGWSMTELLNEFSGRQTADISEIALRIGGALKYQQQKVDEVVQPYMP